MLRGRLPQQVRLAVAFQPAEEGVEDPEGHAAQRGHGLVAVQAAVQVHLRDAPDAVLVQDVDEVPDLHPVADREGQPFQQAPAARVLAAQRLDEPGELRVEEGEQRPHEDLGDPPAAARGEPRDGPQGPLVEGLDVADLRPLQQGAHQAVDEAGGDVADVRVDPDDDVPLQHEQALPEVLALAAVRAVGLEDVAGAEDPAPKRAAIARVSSVEPESITAISSTRGKRSMSSVFSTRISLPMVCPLVQGGEGQGDRGAAAALGLQQASRVAVPAVVEGVATAPRASSSSRVLQPVAAAAGSPPPAAAGRRIPRGSSWPRWSGRRTARGCRGR